MNTSFRHQNARHAHPLTLPATVDRLSLSWKQDFGWKQVVTWNSIPGPRVPLAFAGWVKNSVHQFLIVPQSVCSFTFKPDHVTQLLWTCFNLQGASVQLLFLYSPQVWLHRANSLGKNNRAIIILSDGSCLEGSQHSAPTLFPHFRVMARAAISSWLGCFCHMTVESNKV